MSTSKPNSPLKRARDPNNYPNGENLHDVALAAITSSSRKREVGEFINFLLEALGRNSAWLNSILGKQSHFRCGLMLGAGPNRFQIREIIYPSDQDSIKLEVELKDSEDFDKIAIAALFKLSNADIHKIIEYIKTTLYENVLLKDDMLRGKAMGIQFALLRPLSQKLYRVAERIVVGTSMKCVLPRIQNNRYVKSPAKKPKQERVA